MQWGLGQYSSKVHPVNKQMDWLVIENNFLLLTKFCFFFSLKNTTADCFDLHGDQANRTNHHQNKKSTLLDNIFMIYTVSSENRDRCSPCPNAFSFSTNSLMFWLQILDIHMCVKRERLDLCCSSCVWLQCGNIQLGAKSTNMPNGYLWMVIKLSHSPKTLTLNFKV